jgi:alpha-L-rhamnosidase
MRPSSIVPRLRAGLVASLAAAVLVGAPTVPASTTAPAGLPGQQTGAVAPATVSVTGLETESAELPLGLDVARPRLSWRLQSGARDVDQRSYQVLVATSEERLSSGRVDVWDSGRVASVNQWTDYAGPALRSRTRYFWTVKVGTNITEQSTAQPAWFETAFLDPGQWQAEWITGQAFAAPAKDTEVGDVGGSLNACSPTNDTIRTELCTPPSPVLRTEFEVTKPVARARLYASGLGYGVYYLNGRRTSDAVLDPGFTDYSDRAFYVTHDVTAAVRQGRNAIGVALGRGVYGQQGFNFAGYHTAPWHSDPELRLQLHVTYQDGTSSVVHSDESWKVTDGPSRFDDYMRGETYDARRAAALEGWAEPGFDDSTWDPARASDGPDGRLVAQNAEPIRPQERLPFKTVTMTAPGRYLFDLKDQVAGSIILDGDIPEGAALQIRYGEKLGTDGSIDTNMIPGPFGAAAGDLQKDVYIGRAGRDQWRPEFSYKGFRYAEITGLVLPPDLSLVMAEVWHNDVATTGSWESSSGLTNRIVGNTKRAVLMNLFWQPTDTPIYEKTGYTGDGQLMTGANSYLFDMRRFYTKWAEDIAGAQDPADGELLGIVAPSPRAEDFQDPEWPGPSPGWDVALFNVPDAVYRFGGDERPSVRHVDEMKRYRTWIERHLDPDGVLRGHCQTPSGPNPCTNGLGDWSNLPDMPVGVSLDSTAWYHEMLRLLAQAATLAGDGATADSARAQMPKTTAAFNKAFWTPEINGYRNDPAEPFSQHQQALALGLGLVPAERLGTVGGSLAADVRARDNHLSTGIMGTRFLWDSLTATGHVDEAFAAATQTTYPSYGYWIDVLGWHALGENWPADTRSRSHMMFGTIVQWFFEDLAGYRPTAAGFSEIEFRPEIPTIGLDWVKASTDTVRGKVATSWRKTDNGLLELEVTVPAGSDGVVHVPADSAALVRETGTGTSLPADTSPGVHLIGQQGDRVVYRVGSGIYKFQTLDPATLPDLTVTDLSATQDKPKQTVLKATVANRGGTDAEGVVVEFRDGQTVLGRTPSVGVPAGGSTTVSFTWDTRGINGDHLITAVVDPANTVAESAEGNNTASRSVTVRGNKVNNGSFESSSDGTSPQGWNGTGSTAYDNSGSHASEGTDAVGVRGSGSPTGAGRWTSAPIAVDPGQNYDLAMTVGTVEASSAPSLAVTYLDDGGAVLGKTTAIATPLTGDTALRQLTGRITVPPGVAKVRLTLTGFAVSDLTPTGTAWFDDLWMW